MKIQNALLGALALFAQSAFATYSFEAALVTTYEDLSTYLVPPMQERIDAYLAQDCYNTAKKRGPRDPSTGQNYNCGEVPFGRIKDSGEKLVFNFKLDRGYELWRFSSNFQGVEPGQSAAGVIRLGDKFELNVLLNRHQLSPTLNIPLLDTGGNTGYRVQPGLTDNLLIQHLPTGANHFLLACSYLPGQRVRAAIDRLSTDGEYSWKVLFVRGTERWSTTTEITPGYLTAQSIRVCAVVRVSVVGMKPVVQVIDVAYPQFHGLTLSGLTARNTSVRLHTLGLKIIDWVLGTFTKSSLKTILARIFEENMQKQISNYVRTYSGEVESGKIFEKLLAEQLHVRVSKDIVASFRDAAAATMEQRPIAYKVDLRERCRKLVAEYVKLSGLSDRASVGKEYCEQIVSDVTLQPFRGNAEFSKRACYSYPYSPIPYSATGKNDWWRKKCGIESAVRMTVPDALGPLVSCMSTSLYIRHAPPGSVRVDPPKLDESCAKKAILGLIGVPPELENILDGVDSVEALVERVRNAGLEPERTKEILESISDVFKARKAKEKDDGEAESIYRLGVHDSLNAIDFRSAIRK